VPDRPDAADAGRALRRPGVILDNLLGNLTVEVEPFALCPLRVGWRLRLPAPPKPLLRFVLQGRGAVLDPDDASQPLALLWLSCPWAPSMPSSAEAAYKTKSGSTHRRRASLYATS
jgi:hypothetical protein